LFGFIKFRLKQFETDGLPVHSQVDSTAARIIETVEVPEQARFLRRTPLVPTGV
jgi:hypothetical protein